MAHLQEKRLTDGKQTETNGGGLTKEISSNLTVSAQEYRGAVQLKISERKKMMKKKISSLISEVEILWGVETEPERQDIIIKNLVNDEFIISDAQFANAKAWILNGDRTYMGRNSTKLLLSDFSPTLKQLSTLESDSVRVLTKEELVLMLRDEHEKGARRAINDKFVLNAKENPEAVDEVVQHLQKENLRLGLELMETKEALRLLTKERDNLLSRVRNPSGMLMQQLQGQP